MTCPLKKSKGWNIDHLSLLTMRNHFQLFLVYVREMLTLFSDVFFVVDSLKLHFHPSFFSLSVIMILVIPNFLWPSNDILHGSMQVKFCFKL